MASNGARSPAAGTSDEEAKRFARAGGNDDGRSAPARCQEAPESGAGGGGARDGKGVGVGGGIGVAGGSDGGDVVGVGDALAELPPLDLADGRFADEYTLNFDRPLGVGRNGAVLEATHHNSRESRAVKLFPDTEASRLEIRCQLACRSPDVVSVCEVYRVRAGSLGGLAEQFGSDDEVLVMVMELMAGGELYYRITGDGERMPEADVKEVALQLARALKELHGRGITHRDVKPENILLRHKDLAEVGLTDFGYATPFPPEGARCTLAYAAPEIIEWVLDTRVRRVAGTPYTSACDCWSLGAVLYFCLSGSMPFRSKGDNVLTSELTSSILKGRYSFGGAEWGGVSDEAVDVIQQLMDPCVDTRLTAKGLLDHAWLDGIGDEQPQSPKDKGDG